MFADVVFSTNAGTTTLTERLRLTYNGYALFNLPAAQPPDAQVANSRVAMWLDTAGAKLMFRVRDSSGAYKSGSIALA